MAVDLPDAGHTGDADVHGAAGIGHQLQQQLLRLLPVVGPGRLDERDRPRQRRAVAVADRGGQLLDVVHLAQV